MRSSGSTCSVAHCKNRQNICKSSKNPMSFHRFPKDAKLRKEWVRKCNRKGVFDPDNKRICSVHFLPTDYEDFMKARLMGFPPKKLNANAIPSLYLFSTDEPKPAIESKRSLRYKAKENKELVKTLLEATDSPLTGHMNKTKSNIDLSKVSVTKKETDFDLMKRRLAKLEGDNNALTFKNSQLEDKICCIEERLNKSKRNFDSRVKRILTKKHIELAFEQNDMHFGYADHDYCQNSQPVVLNRVPECSLLMVDTCLDESSDGMDFVTFNIADKEDKDLPTQTGLPTTNVQKKQTKNEKPKPSVKNLPSRTKKNPFPRSRISKNDDNFRKELRMERKIKANIKKKLERRAMGESEVEMSPLLKALLSTPAVTEFRTRNGRPCSQELNEAAINLYRKSPRMYKHISKFIDLPSKATILKGLGSAQLNVGVYSNVADTLKSMDPTDNILPRFCTLTFDEIAIVPMLQYNHITDRMDGFVDFGNQGGRMLNIADHVLVFLLQGVCYKWKMPLAHYFTHGLISPGHLSSIIVNLIEFISAAGFSVVATVCDMGSANLSALNRLMSQPGGSILDKYFCVAGQNIQVIYDSSHLLKAMRNNLLNYNFIFDDNKFVCWGHLEEFYAADKGLAKVARRLTDKHINKNEIQKIKVSLATQVFSYSVAAGMLTLAKLGHTSEESIQTAEFIKLIDETYDSLNGTTTAISDGKILRTACTLKSQHFEAWHKALDLFQTLQVFDGITGDLKKTLRFQTGWITTLRSVSHLCRTLLENVKIKSIAPKRFSLEGLEHLFRMIKQQHARPNMYNFVSILKSIVVNNFDSFSSPKMSRKLQESTYLADVENFLALSRATNDSLQPPEPSLDIPYNAAEKHVVDYVTLPKNSEHPPTLVCVSGFIVRKLLESDLINVCDSCTNALVAPNLQQEYGVQSRREYRLVTGVSTYPSSGVIHAANRAFDIFNRIFEDDINNVGFLAENIARDLARIMREEINYDFCTCPNHKKYVIATFYRIFSRIFLAATANRIQCNVKKKIFNQTETEK